MVEQINKTDISRFGIFVNGIGGVMSVSEGVSCGTSRTLGYTDRNEYSNDEMHGKLVCASCGKIVEKVYQNGACKPCLLQEFRRYISVIDDFQANIS